MEMCVLAENTATSKLYAKKHGLSIYIQTEQRKILFDVGPDDTFIKNARAMGVNIAEVDTVVISHGHKDHGGALALFLEHNQKATIYIHQKALEPHYSKHLVRFDIGLRMPAGHESRFVFVDGHLRIDEELLLFSQVSGDTLMPKSNGSLLMKDSEGYRPDDFAHEQNLLVTQAGKHYLFTGCSHKGIINIMGAAALFTDSLDCVVGGFHLFNPATGKVEDSRFIDDMANALCRYKTHYYTCHCTGTKAFRQLKNRLGDRIDYISGGACMEL